MKVCTIVFGVLVACVVSMAAENGPLMAVLQPGPIAEDQQLVMVEDNQGVRQKRGLLLGAGALGLGAVGLGAAGLVGAGLIGAKAGLVGGLVAGKLLAHKGRSYGGGYGGYYGGGYGGHYGGGYGGHYGGGYGGGYGYAPVYRTAYVPTYVVAEPEPWC